MNLFRLLLLFLLLPGASSYAGGDARQEKMCWAHYVGWGFNQSDGYDKAALSPEWMLHPFNDRTLLGRDLQWDSGIFFGARKQIDAARAYGFDGFCIDVVDPAAYVSALSRFFRDAEGTTFKIALCIDRLNYPDDYLLKHLGGFIRTYKDHPNACRIDGKMVIFVYNIAGKKTEEWLALRQELAKRGLDAYYIAQPMHETSTWNEPARLREVLDGFESLYDFGCNGFFPEQMKERLANGRAALKEKRPDGMLVGGIAVGYIGFSSAFYRPFLNTGTLRHNWEAALANDADWVCITTWNDYVEHTQFEPSAINRDALLLINREYLDKWRGTVPPARPPRVIYSYHEETVAGDDLTIEVMNFSYTTPVAKARVRLLDAAGKLLHEFPEISLTRKEMGVRTLRLNHAEQRDWSVIRVQGAVYAAGEKPEFKELYPIVRRPGRVESVRTVRVRQDDLTAPAVSLELRKTGGRSVAHIRISGWTFAGKYELLRNGWPVAEGEISHLKKPFCEIAVPLPEPARSPADVYLVRLTDVSDRVGFSNPAVDVRPGIDGKSLQPVVVTGSDFDENWPIWSRRISRLKKAEVRNMEFPERDIFRVRYDFTEGEGNLLVSSSGWTVPARLGCRGGFSFDVVPEASPAWKKAPGPDGAERNLLAFDGKDDNIALASRTMPYGPFTLEFLLRPGRKGSPMTLFSDRCGIELSLDAELRPQLRRGNAPMLAGKKLLPPERWSHLAAVYTGKRMQLYLDGVKIGECDAEACTIPINSLARIGNALELNNGYLGELAGFSLEGAVRSPKEFQLLNPRK